MESRKVQYVVTVPWKPGVNLVEHEDSLLDALTKTMDEWYAESGKDLTAGQPDLNSKG
ncbi:hypothetical protein [Streptomyces luteogriseus]|uniref:hypothetical protein n=1 Tax=Streptomyces luteogriseus TaxID=68233 RepID=UPI0037BDD995